MSSKSRLTPLSKLQEQSLHLTQIPKQRKYLLIAVALLAAFSFRLFFGLCSEFWTGTEDEKQIYLIGLKFYTTRNWPYFGPDVTQTIQIPGALQGLAAGLPFFVLPIPEAPYLLVNFLSFASLAFFAWYCARRLPNIPKWLIWSWLLTAPWTLGLSTQVYNPSYVLCGAILFFVGALETYPGLSTALVPRRWANLMMGFGLFWIMQFHLSWVVLLPYVFVSFYLQIKKEGKKGLTALAWFALGAIGPLFLLVPTFIKYGLSQGIGSTNETVTFSVNHVLQHVNIVEGVLGRFLSFASFEVPRFIGSNTAARLAFMKEHLWISPFVIFLTVVGILQSVALFLLWFRRPNSQKDWPGIKYFTLGTVILLYLSFIFSLKSPVSHTFYLTFPIAMLYSFYCWNDFLKKKLWRTFAVIVIVSGIIFNAGLAAHNCKHTSIYVDRNRIQRAINEKNFHVLGERRPGTRY